MRGAGGGGSELAWRLRGSTAGSGGPSRCWVPYHLNEYSNGWWGVWVEEVNHFLAAADLLELYAQALVDPLQEAGGDPELRELAVEQHGPLGEAEVGPGVQGVVIAEKLDVLLRELCPG